MADAIEKIVELSKKTGDTIVVLDHHGQPAYVVVGFERYQRLVNGADTVAGLTQEQLMEKINRDIAAWRESQADANQAWDDFSPATDGNQQHKTTKKVSGNIENSLNQAKKESKEDTYYFEPIE